MIDLNVNSVKMTIRKTKPSSKGSYLQTIRNVEVKTESTHGYRFITKREGERDKQTTVRNLNDFRQNVTDAEALCLNRVQPVIKGSSLSHLFPTSRLLIPPPARQHLILSPPPLSLRPLPPRPSTLSCHLLLHLLLLLSLPHLLLLLLLSPLSAP